MLTEIISPIVDSFVIRSQISDLERRLVDGTIKCVIEKRAESALIHFEVYDSGVPNTYWRDVFARKMLRHPFIALICDGLYFSLKPGKLRTHLEAKPLYEEPISEYLKKQSQ